MIGNKKVTHAPCYVLSEHPLIVTTYSIFLFNRAIRDFLFNKFRGKRAYFIVMLMWASDSLAMAKTIKFLLSRCKKNNRDFKFIFLCNTESELDFFQKFKIQSVYCNHNALLDERIFTVTNENKIYDGVYNAQMGWFKRHYLASKISNLALITYFAEIGSSRAYYRLTKKLLPNAVWLNEPVNGHSTYISSSEVSRFLNSSKAGLCLSPVEGPMYASMEYMLCGLPVVSTKSMGGRSVFFDKEYVKIVKSSRKSVRSGVDDIIKMDIKAGYIRNRTLEKIKPHRERFIEAIQCVYDEEDSEKRFREEWSAVFINKMVRWENL